MTTRQWTRRGGALALMALAALALGGCATPHAVDGEPLRKGHGLLAFHVNSNADAFLSFVDYADTSTFASRFGENMVGAKGSLVIKAGEKFYLMPVPAGDYMFSKFTMGNKFAWLQATNRFKVRAGAITYIGHIRVQVANDRFGLRAQDRELDMRTHLAEVYPGYFQAMDFEKSVAELNLR